MKDFLTTMRADEVITRPLQPACSEVYTHSCSLSCRVGVFFTGECLLKKIDLENGKDRSRVSSEHHESKV